MSQLRKRFPRNLIIVILLACCSVALVGLGLGGFIMSHSASPRDDTLAILKNNQVPAGDWRDEAIRLKGIPDIPEVVSTTPANYTLGDSTDFYVNNNDTGESRKLSAHLAYETQNVYFFIEEGVKAEDTDVKRLVDEFQSEIYPTNREFFGSEWTPGVDGDPRIYMLYAHGLGKHTQAYFDTISEYSLLAHPYSNEKEIFVLNVDAGPLNDDYWRPTLAHEFQHMIHWYQNRNAELWLNEGAAVLAQSINGFDVGSQMSFLDGPNLQLNTWANLSTSAEETVGHYNAAYLFMQYFLDRFGSKASQTLVASHAPGIIAVDSTLATLGLTDITTGKTLTVEDVFADWAIANYLNDRRMAQGQYGYERYTETIAGPTDTITDCPTGLISTNVHQFGTRYIELTCQGNLTINFTGSQTVSVVPTILHNGHYAMWSSREDQSDTTLTREFDLRRVESATLNYWAWWEIETDYDYAYVEVSADGGQTWKIVQTPSGTGANPTGSNLGWGYTGCSGGGDPGEDCSASWINETVDLSAYAGQKILVRLEYITDTALSYPGFMLDDISIPEINFICNFEKDNCGWDGKGFVSMDNVLPQTFVVQLIHGSGGQRVVERMQLDASNQGSLSLTLKDREAAILVISGTTPFTTETANFELEIK